jgi:hypothetical protein
MTANAANQRVITMETQKLNTSKHPHLFQPINILFKDTIWHTNICVIPLLMGCVKSHLNYLMQEICSILFREQKGSSGVLLNRLLYKFTLYLKM